MRKAGLDTGNQEQYRPAFVAQLLSNARIGKVFQIDLKILHISAFTQ
jgi:hypothetical protein